MKMFRKVKVEILKLESESDKKIKVKVRHFVKVSFQSREQVLPMMIRLFKKVKVKVKTRKNESKLFDQSKMGKGARC